MNSPKINPKLAVLAGVLFVSFSSIFTKMSTAPSLIIATFRLGFSSLILLPFVLKNNIDEIKNIRIGDLVICTISGIFLALHFATWLESIKHTSITSSTVLVNTHPIFVVMGSILILKQRMSKNALLGIGIGLVGSFVISMGDSSLGSNVIYGDMLAVMGAFFVAGYMMIGSVVRKRLSVNAYTFIVYSTCTVTLLIMDFASKTPLYPYPKLDWALFLAMALLCTMMGHSVFNWALEYINPSFVSMGILGEPVFATVWAFLIFGQVPTLSQVVGGMTILAGISVFIRSQEVKQEDKKLEGLEI